VVKNSFKKRFRKKSVIIIAARDDLASRS